MAKRTLSIRLQASDVFYAPKSLGLKAARQNSIMCGDMELLGLHPLCLDYAQSIIGTETIAFTDWVSKVLKKNGEYPVRSCWSDRIRNLEKDLYERNE
jgi:hypothetical protein